MRSLLGVVSLALFLSACQTTSGEKRNLVVGAGDGGASLNVCIGDFAYDHIFTLTIRKVEERSDGRSLEPTDTGTRTMVLSSLTAPTKIRGSTFEPGWSCKFWDIAAAPGTYALTRLYERYYDPNPSGGLLYLLAKAAAASVRENDEIVFVDEQGRLLADAPTFEIRDGEVSDLGTLNLVGERAFRENPVRDPNGYWDGQTTEQVEDRRVLVRYEPPAAVPSADALDQNGSGLPRVPRRLGVLENRTMILEDFPEVGSAVQ